VEVVTSVQRRRRWTPEQKLEIVKQSNEPDNPDSMVARQFGISAAQLFQWRNGIVTLSDSQGTGSSRGSWRGHHGAPIPSHESMTDFDKYFKAPF